MQKNSLMLKVVDRSGVIYSGEVSSVSSKNKKGKLDILTLHANLVSVVYEGISFIDAISSVEHKIGFPFAIMRSYKDSVTVLLPGS